MDIFGILIYLATFTVSVFTLDVTGPSDTVVSRGQTGVMLECLDSDPVHIAFWQKLITNLKYTQIYYYSYINGVGTPDVRVPDYVVDTENYHNLLIPGPVQSSHTGIYSCTVYGVAGSNYKRTAALVIVDDMNCDDGTVNLKNYELGDVLHLSCSVTVDGPLVPHLEWKHGNVVEDDAVYSVETLENGSNQVTSTVNIAIEASFLNLETYSCHLRFEQGSSEEQDPPQYHDSCAVDIAVTQQVSGVSTTPSNDDVEGGGPVLLKVGDVITCRARARPFARFKWVKVKGEGPESLPGTDSGENESQLTLTQDMLGGPSTYQCLATNDVPNPENPTTSRGEVTFIVQNKDSGNGKDNPNPQGSTDPETDPSNISGTLSISLISLVTVALAMLL